MQELFSQLHQYVGARMSLLVLYARADGRYLQARLLPPQHCFACRHCLVSSFPLELRAVTQLITALIGVVQEQTAAKEGEGTNLYVLSTRRRKEHEHYY